MNDTNRIPMDKAIRFVRANLEQQLLTDPDKKATIVPVLTASPGCGKTSIIRELCNEMNLHLFYSSAAKPLEFWSGLPDIDGEGKDKFVEWTEAEIIHRANQMARDNSFNPSKDSSLPEDKRRYRGAVIFLDDIHIAPKEIQNYMFEFILERSLHGKKLDDNVAIIAAMNDSSTAGNRGFNSAVLNRLSIMNVYMEKDYWYTIMGKKLHPFVASFINTHGGEFLEEENPKSPYGTYRSWTECSKQISHYIEFYGIDENDSDLKDDIKQIASGYISGSLAQQFAKHILTFQKFNFRKMLSTGVIKMNKNSISDQFILPSIVRYIKNEKEANILVDFINKIITSEDVTSYTNFLTATALELLAYDEEIKVSSDTGKKNKMQKLSEYIFIKADEKFGSMILSISRKNI